MNYNWTLLEDGGQPAYGFVETHQTTADGGKKVFASIHFLPQVAASNYGKNATITLFVEGTKESLTDGLFHGILDDLTEKIKTKESVKFPRQTAGKIEYALTQTFLVNKMPSLQYVSHGDYAIV